MQYRAILILFKKYIRKIKVSILCSNFNTFLKIDLNLFLTLNIFLNCLLVTPGEKNFLKRFLVLFSYVFKFFF